MKKILPILLILIGLGAGVGAGLALRPPPPEPEHAEDGHDEEHAEPKKAEPVEIDLEDRAFVKINNQFVVPVVKGDAVEALVVLSISLETNAADTEILYNHEPKLRDAFIGILFDYAYAGGFGSDFTSSPNLDRLRLALLEVSQKIVPDKIISVLITDIVRQDT